MATSIAGVLVAVALFGLFATLIQPAATAAQTEQLNSATGQLAELFRLAQTEAQRTDQYVAVSYSVADETFSAFTVSTLLPFKVDAVVYHPVSKQPLQWQAESIAVNNPGAPFSLEAGQTSTIVYDSWGTPFGSSGAKITQLATTTITLSHNGVSRAVQIHPFSGRVQIK